MKLQKQQQRLKLNPEVMDMFKQDTLQVIASLIKRSVISDVLPTVVSNNFIGEALDYINDHNLILSDDLIKTISTQMATELREQIDSLILWDSESKHVLISLYIAEFEFGDYYKPSLHIITNAINQSIKVIQEGINV